MASRDNKQFVATGNERLMESRYPNNSQQFHEIVDNFSTLEEVSGQIRREGLEKCGLIFGIDYTMSNNIQGRKTFGGKSLHDLTALNPYQQVICILGETMHDFQDDGLIPAFGFGDTKTKGQSVFPLKEEGFCEGFDDVWNTYNDVTPTVKMAGPTNFAPLINEAIEIVKHKKMYHLLVITADGQVTNEDETIDAIVRASKYPLSIIQVGVGDGPWTVCEEFMSKLPHRQFDNFQFVNFHDVMENARNPQAAFALAALMKIPGQYREISTLGMLNFKKEEGGKVGGRPPQQEEQRYGEQRLEQRNVGKGRQAGEAASPKQERLEEYQQRRGQEKVQKGQPRRQEDNASDTAPPSRGRHDDANTGRGRQDDTLPNRGRQDDTATGRGRQDDAGYPNRGRQDDAGSGQSRYVDAGSGPGQITRKTLR